MNKLLILLLLFASTALADFTVTYQGSNCQVGNQTSAGLTVVCGGGVIAPPVTPPPVTPPVTPPPAPAVCPGVKSINIGNVVFNGAQIDSPDMYGTDVAYGKLIIPAGTPVGKTSSIAVFANGNATAWRQVFVSKTPCDFTGRPSQGLTATAYVSNDAAAAGTINIPAGETWYVTIRNQDPVQAKTTCGPGNNCAFGLRSYPFN